MTAYEKEVRERFPALVADPIWPSVERMVREDWRDSDELWFDGVVQHCIDLCKRLGLPMGPARCPGCDRLWPEAGDVAGPADDCPECHARRAEEAARKAAHEAWYAALSPEEKARVDKENHQAITTMMHGLIARDVQ